MEIKAGRYTFAVKKQIGSGSFGDTYFGTDKMSQDQVAIKVSPINSMTTPKLSNEASIIKLLSGAPGFVSLKYYGIEGDVAILVMELAGKNLNSLYTFCHHKFTLKTVAMIVWQAISRLQYMHKKGYIHRDIKPENFTIGLGKNSNVVYLIDFGLSKKYTNSNGQPLKLSDAQPFVGTPAYASISTHFGIQLSRRDDLESLGYMLVYLLKGMLPWMGLDLNCTDDYFRRVGESKRATSTEELCKGLPIQIKKYMDHVKALKFDEEPNYEYYYSLFRSLLDENGYCFDYKYDWVIDRYEGNGPAPEHNKTPKFSRNVACVSLKNINNRTNVGFPFQRK